MERGYGFNPKNIKSLFWDALKNQTKLVASAYLQPLRMNLFGGGAFEEQ